MTPPLTLLPLPDLSRPPTVRDGMAIHSFLGRLAIGACVPRLRAHVARGASPTSFTLIGLGDMTVRPALYLVDVLVHAQAARAIAIVAAGACREAILRELEELASVGEVPVCTGIVMPTHREFAVAALTPKSMGKA
jgi:hypothetical protein